MDLLFHGRAKNKMWFSCPVLRTSTTKNIDHLRCMLQDFGIHVESPTLLICDNKSAIHITYNPIFQERMTYNPIFQKRTKDIEINTHYVKQHYLASLTFPTFPRHIKLLTVSPSLIGSLGLSSLFANSCCLTLHEFEEVVMLV